MVALGLEGHGQRLADVDLVIDDEDVECVAEAVVSRPGRLGRI